MPQNRGLKLLHRRIGLSLSLVVFLFELWRPVAAVVEWPPERLRRQPRYGRWVALEDVRRPPGVGDETEATRNSMAERLKLFLRDRFDVLRGLGERGRLETCGDVVLELCQGLRVGRCSASDVAAALERSLQQDSVRDDQGHEVSRVFWARALHCRRRTTTTTPFRTGRRCGNVIGKVLLPCLPCPTTLAHTPAPTAAIEKETPSSQHDHGKPGDQLLELVAATLVQHRLAEHNLSRQGAGPLQLRQRAVQRRAEAK